MLKKAPGLVLLALMATTCGRANDRSRISRNYRWGDPVILVRAAHLPMTEVHDGLSSVGIFSFVNYRSVWNHVGHICIHNVGPSPLGALNAINFDVVGSAIPRVGVLASFSNDGRVCADVPMTIGAGSETLLVIQTAWGSRYPLPSGIGPVSYQFEITSAADITIDDDRSEAIVGEFPIRSDPVRVVHQ